MRTDGPAPTDQSGLCTATLLLVGLAAAISTGPTTADGHRVTVEQPWSNPGNGDSGTATNEQPWS
ncbi:hypothetical protein ACIODT_05530 [Streptomyces sp. NPDC088251]|uniref:hypothetical protein n=1 Tax=unclassified Streptomyces TaxID=2593676 RepID=UPI0033E399E3